MMRKTAFAGVPGLISIKMKDECHMGNNRLGKKVESRDGFTLIEVLIAMLILSIGVLGVASMQTSATKGVNTSGRLSLNANCAMDRMERLLQLPYDHADLAGSVYNEEVAVDSQGLAHTQAMNGDGLDNDLDGEIDEDGESGDLSIQWAVIDGYPIDATKTIRVSVTRGTGQTAKTVTFVSHKIDKL